ncbi:hypothetical protein [Lelliottia sp. T2.26D-8]|uniref:hypothetical protein n=1 Tax=Lelliottia sp. T2.26D-8 TaxID=3041165 RepID=UPI00247756BB|nr:hypothetical protein [Lelliottia sp. T2.26D-8]CAI9399098.1 hypothetical protein CCAJJPOJ_00150 [Lelliottia sp. T2.26D-8]
MKRTDAPKKQPVPFGVNGPREDLLPTTPAGNNQASYDSGFPPVTMILKSAGGLPPKGEDFNQILFELSALNRWASSGTLNSYDSTFATSIGGYAKGSMVLSDSGLIIYMNTVDDNSTNPNTGGAGWVNLLAFLGLGDGSGRYLGTRVFTASGTYTPTAGTKKVVVTVVGGGGGGGGTFATNASQNAAGSGGGGGAEAVGVFTTGFSGVAMVIGSAGVSAAAANGTDGGVTSFGTLLTAAGGGGGPRGIATGSGLTSGSSGGSTVTGTALISKAGQDGFAGIVFSLGLNLSGKGGDTNYGYGGSAGATGTSPGGFTGLSGKDYGSGGGGGGASISTASQAGGAGRPGVIIVEEYA